MNHRPRLLIVEDEPFIRLVLTDALESAGYSIIESSTGQDAIAQLELPGVAAVVTDIRLGAGPNGWDVARCARQHNPHVPVVYMSGDSAADWVTQGVSTSMMVQKPFAMAQMITALSSLLVSAALP